MRRDNPPREHSIGGFWRKTLKRKFMRKKRNERQGETGKRTIGF